MQRISHLRITVRGPGARDWTMSDNAVVIPMTKKPAPEGAPKGPPPKDLYELGEIPPLGHVPPKMYAWAIRKERHGPPEEAMQVEVVPTWPIGDDEVLVLVMAAGVN